MLPTLVVVGLSLGGGGAAACDAGAPSFFVAFPPRFLLVFLVVARLKRYENVRSLFEK